MEADPQVLLVLIAMRLSGKRPVPAGDEPFKMLKKPLALAMEQGFVVETEISTLGKNGKPAAKKAKGLDLTEKGTTALQAAGPDVQAAIAARQKAAVLQSLEADRATLRSEVVAALSAKSKAGDPTKALADLGKAVKQIADKVEKLETAVQARGDDALLARIDQAFATLQHKLAGVTTASPAGAHAAPPPAAQESLESVLRRCYRTLRQFAEFNDGLVPIPRLYHEARRSLPQLSVEAFHRELLALWERRALELKVLNEVRTASEPDKAITRGENLYYYVYWQNP